MSPMRERILSSPRRAVRALHAAPEREAALAADGSPDEDPIDRAHLARFSLGSLTLEREILGLFLAQLPLSIEQLRFAATDREWQIAAHTIKGSARAVGAWQVAGLALEAEQTSGVADDAAREDLLAALEQACEAVQAYVAAALPAEVPHA